MEELVDQQLKEIETLFSQGQKDEALTLIKMFLAKDPSNLRGLNDLGAILQAKGDKAGAEEAFRRAFNLASNHQPTGINLALCLGARQKWAEARALVQKLLAVNQNEARLWVLLGRIEKGQGNIEAAVSYFDRALVLDPDQPQIHQVRSSLIGQMDGNCSNSMPAVVLGYHKFLTEPPVALCRELEKLTIITEVGVNELAHLIWPIQSSEVLWLEAGTSLSAEVSFKTAILARKKVILRLFGFEIVENEAAKINYGTISDLVFTSHYMRNLFIGRFPALLKKLKVHVIHPGLAPSQAPAKATPSPRPCKIAWIGKQDAPREPLMMLQAFSFLLTRNPDLELHIAGPPDNKRHCLDLPDFLEKNLAVKNATTFYGQLQNPGEWLKDKDFILSTCPYEDLTENLLRAVDLGLQPLIYDFPGAGSLFPTSWLWNDFNQLAALFARGWDPEEGRRLIAEKYNVERQAQNILKVITGESVVVEDSPIGQAPLVVGNHQ